MPALIFDCDGVLIDTEKGGHLRAFNQMWREFGIPWNWSTEQYAAKLQISGGKERLSSLQYEADFRAAWGIPITPTEWDRVVTVWHRRKTQIFLDIIKDGGVAPRPGVRRLAEEAHAAGWPLAIASASAEPSVRAALRHVMGDRLAAAFHVLAGDSVHAKKPAPDVYELAAQTLGITPADCIVVEDTRNGVRAALAAGMTCLVTPTGLSAGHDFTGASLVVSSLGSACTAEQTTVLSNPRQMDITDQVDLSHLAQLICHPEASRSTLATAHHST